MTIPVITEAQRNELRKRAARATPRPAIYATIGVLADHLLDLLDCADREAEMLDAACRIVDSGILCDPGCCSDDCGCEDLRELASEGESDDS